MRVNARQIGLRVYVACTAVSQAWFTASEPSSFAWRMVDRTGQAGWVVIAVLGLLGFVALLDILVMDLWFGIEDPRLEDLRRSVVLWIAVLYVVLAAGVQLTSPGYRLSVTYLIDAAGATWLVVFELRHLYVAQQTGRRATDLR